MEEFSFNNYQKMAMRSCKKWASKKEMMTDVALGLAGEAGEVADIIKKDLAGAKALELAHTIEELGDVMWYLAEASEWLEISLEDIAKANIEKLKKRHPEGFSGYGKRN